MKGRRTAAMLCVLLGHALVVFMLINLTRSPERRAAESQAGYPSFASEPIYLETALDGGESYDQGEFFRRNERSMSTQLAPPSMSSGSLAAGAAGEEGASSSPGFVDWPKEGHDAAARVLAREAESQRVAKLFAGPQGTWASLTKRQQSELNHFRWKPGVDGLERDEKGNTLWHVSEGCTLVNFSIISCALGKKPPAYGDMFKDMRLYFDEQRRPATNEGNGREPESMRPPKWSKPLE
ncbi:MAG TPA: hypothetical protein VM146_19660 [Steroidobacteraceae bacterium]|nr:hypothetical protein [Steroidobacteraceae bacterium]